ncbi:Pyrophosphate-energized vacuolar membrane proton pump 1 [Glycine soja]
MGVLSEGLTQILIPVTALIGIGFALLQWLLLSRVRVSSADHTNADNGYRKSLIGDSELENGVQSVEVTNKCAEIQHAISVALANAVFSTVAFLLGALNSVLSGFLGMKIATYANARTTPEARKGIGKAFVTAFRSGPVMGFLLSANGLLVLYITINLFKLYYRDDWEGLYESITGHGLGGLSMALFERVGGGIYTKAADFGADQVGNLNTVPEDDPRNPAVIVDNVGDNVGDIAGMGSDLFGSYAESSCAALFVASISSFGTNHDYTAMTYPLIISSMGIVVWLIATLFATDLFEITNVSQIEPSLKRQLLIATILITAGIAIVSFTALPSEFTLYNFGARKVVKNWHLFFCVAIGLLAGLGIGYITEYYTLAMLTGEQASSASEIDKMKPLFWKNGNEAMKQPNRVHAISDPVQDVADSCRTGAATNLIFGLALGYKSVIIPVFAIAIAIHVSFSLAAMYGIGVAALGMLSTITTSLAIDAYGPISDNAGGIAEMAGMRHKIRERTDALDAAGNTTAAIGKGFAIGLAVLASLALFGAYVSRAGIKTVNVMTPKVFIGLIVGAMLP